MPVIVHVQNIGNSPALRLIVDCREFDFYANDIISEIEKLKLECRTSYLNGEPRGETLFPSETRSIKTVAKVAKSTVGNALKNEKIPNVRMFSGTFLFSVIYQSAIDETLFQTSIVMMMIEDHPDGMMHSIPIDNKDIPAPIPYQQILLVPYPATYEAN